MDDQKLATDRTIPLVKSKRYESFQFHAISEPANKTITAEELFKKEILYVLGWIKSRCRDTDLPKEINELPKPEDYKSYNMNEIKPFRYDIGYKLEVVFIEDEEKIEKTWAIQIVEPDRGPFPENPEKNRYVVPGRLFVTDIGLKLFDNKVEIGTRTYVDEPEGTTHECDAFRQVFIKQLIKDNDIKLKAATEEMREWPITEKPFLIKNNVNLESLIEWIKYPKRQALAVIYAENKDKIANKENEEGLEMKIEDLENKRATFDELARDLRGYAFFFNIPYERRLEFLKKMEIPSEKSDLFIIEADKYDLKEPYNYSMYDFLNETAVQEEVYRKIKKYFEHKHANFGKVQFVPDVRENSFSEFMNVKRSKQEIIAEHDIILHDKRQEYESLLTKRDEQIEMFKNKLKVKEVECEKVKERLSDFENKKTELETRHSLEETKIKHKLERERFKGNRPKDFKDLNKWVSKYLCDSIILSKRAQDEISKIDKEYSIDNICDSIEHLAMDYYEQLMGLITEEERNHRCSEIYNSYINITYLSLPKITNKKDYEFTYIKKNGSSTTAYIDQHVYLKGSEGRIYFTFDKDDQRLIIASLPKHLTY